MDIMDNTTKQVLTLNISEDELIDEMNKEEVELLTPVIVYMCTIMIVGVVGNGHICYIYRSTSDADKLFMLCLALPDLFTCAIMTPVELAFIPFQYNFESELLCSVSTVFHLWPTLCSVCILVIMAFDKYNKFCRHGDIKLDFQNARLICIGIFVVSFVFSVPSFLLRGIRQGMTERHSISTYWCAFEGRGDGPTGFEFWYVVLGGVFFIVCLISISVVNCLLGARMCPHIKKKEHSYGTIFDTHFRKIERRPKRQDAASRVAREVRKQSLRIILVSFAFVISYVPIIVLTIVLATVQGFPDDMNESSRICYLFFNRSYLLNSAINPVIYLRYDSHFRDNCKQLLPGIFASCFSNLKTCCNKQVMHDENIEVH